MPTADGFQQAYNAQSGVDDVDQAIDHYLTHAGVAVSVDFIGALESLFDQISRQPASGSPRYAHELNIPGLRSRSMEKFPHIVFYLEDFSLTLKFK